MFIMNFSKFPRRGKETDKYFNLVLSPSIHYFSNKWYSGIFFSWLGIDIYWYIIEKGEKK